ncbi:MAG: NosD domain-containing protein [Natronomonas sp.]|jgi:parallel beta-helix repeat protein|uniref:NosD domain-containing protein n=1 Tax=Natronomonas sp. TaxID=2184060 RepID=UPI00287055D7|nr:NosD domain-containing protein [Natronomonas sp.]MDR9431237.1 NosD domain-containing protein [Natronomonas sp.]
MTPTRPVDDADANRDRGSGTVIAVAVGVVVLGGSIGLFVVDFGSATPEPVDFDETVSVGLTLEDELRLGDESEDIELPRMEVFYSQYPYVVGYYGVDSFVAAQREPTHERQFGFPAAAYVTDYADLDPGLTDDGLPRSDREPGWIAPESAVYVVDSDARMPSGRTAILPFGDRDDARAFADEHGGRILGWDALLEADVELDDADTVRDRVRTQRVEADRVVESRSALRDRPVGAVVGENGTTVQDAIEAASPNTTVLVPEGIHEVEEPVEIDRPVTLQGEGDANIVGDGNSTVLVVRASRSAIVGVDVSGVGNGTPDAAVVDDHSHRLGDASHDSGDTVGDDYWDEDVEEDYATGDTAIAVETAQDVLIADLSIDTDAAGVILYDSPGVVVRNITVVGRENYREGHMGLVAMRSPGVVEHSAFLGGLDGVYTHRAHGIVIRNNEIRGNRMGVHLMFTSDSLVSDNVVSGQEFTGIHVMTGPQRNAVVGNRISDTETALIVGGSNSYIADNVLTESYLGLRIDATASIIEGNVIADNRDGAETWAQLPTNRVTHNDFVDNEQHVAVSSGRLRVWSHDGEGNYWEGAVGSTDGTVIQRPYTPTDPVDGRLHRVDGAGTLARAPAIDALAGFQGAVPGMRADEVIDTAPLCAPVNEVWFERTGRGDTEPICQSDGRLDELETRA